MSRWLEENHDVKPFLLWVDFFDVHEPWDPPEYLVRRYERPGYDGPPMIHPNYGTGFGLHEAGAGEPEGALCGRALSVNKWIGHVLAKIEELSLYDDTVSCSRAITECSWVSTSERGNRTFIPTMTGSGRFMRSWRVFH